MKKAIKISAVLVALVVLAAMAFVFTSSAAEATANTLDDLTNNLAQEDTTVKLGADIGTDTDLTVYNVAGKVTLDLNGKKLYSGTTGSLFVQTGVTNPVEFVITDSVGGGAIIAPTATLIENFGGTVKITGGTIVVDKLVNTDAGKKVPAITISQFKDDNAATGTWTSFDPTNCLVLGFAATNGASPVDARATYTVAPAVYNITYTVPAGANNPNATAHPTYTIWDEFTFAPATANGYEFKGWYLKDNDSPFNGVVAGNNFYHIEIVGKFEPTVYTITYGGTGYENNENNPDSFTVTQPNIKLGAPTKRGYEFKGWFTEPDGAGTQVTQIECSTTYNNVTLYPDFDAIVYNIKYVTYGGTPAPTKTTYTVEDEFDFEDVTRPGYNFKGWYTTAIPGDDDVEKTGITKGEIGDITVYAQYETITYTITYKPNDAITSDLDSFVKEFTVETPTFFLPVPELKPGYTFVGWRDSLGTIVSAVVVGTHTDIEVEPVIKSTVYKIFYEFGTGTILSDINNDKNATDWYQFTIDQSPALVAPTRAHYNFLGWSYVDPYDNADAEADIEKFLEENGLDYDEATKTWTIPAGTANNVRVFAVWEATEYTIEYNEDGYTYKILTDANGVPVLDANGDVQYVDASDAVTTDKEQMVKVELNDDKAVLSEDAPVKYTYIEDVELPIPTREGYKFVRWYDENTGTYLTPDASGDFTIEKGTRSGDLKLVAEWEITKYKVTVKYQFNDDYYGVNADTLKTNPDYIDDGRTFLVAVENVEVVYGTPYTHEVDFKALNGFVPDQWNLEVIMGAEDKTYIIYFEPVIKSTVVENGNLVITYHDGTKKSVALGAVSGVKYEAGKLVYVDDNGTSTTVAYATSAELAQAVETINTAITNLTKNKVDKNTAEIEKINAALADLAKINENADAIKNLKTSVEDLQAQIDALAGKNTTYLVLIIIVGIIALAGVGCGIFAIVKPR